MELQDYVRILRRRWAIIVAITLVALTAAAFVTYRTTPQYTSTARVFVSTAPSDTDSAYQGGLFSEQRVSSYADLVSGLELTRRVVDSLGLDLTAAELSKRVSASVVPDTVLLKISVSDPDPVQAQKITNAMVSELSDFVKELETPAGAKQALIKATLIDPARLPESPSSPNPTRNLGLGLVLGLLIGFGFAVLRELLDTSVKAAEVAEEISGAPVLGGIGEDPEAVKHPLITALSPHAPRSEAFRVLRTNVQFLEVDSASKAFVVTSSMPAEGKSSTAINLAVAMAQGDQKVLLLDADLRRPQIGSRLGLEQGVGLTTILLGKVELDDALQEHAESGLTVLTSGATPPNPAELLQSHAMEDLLATVRERFDVVIIDSPPLLPVTDATLLSSLADGAIIVMRHGHTTREQLAGGVDRLEAVGSAPLGVVINRIPHKRNSYGYGYGYGYGYAPESAAETARGFFRRGTSGRTEAEVERARAERKVTKAQARADRTQAKALARAERAEARAQAREEREQTRAGQRKAGAIEDAPQPNLRQQQKLTARQEKARARAEKEAVRRQMSEARKEQRRRAAEEAQLAREARRRERDQVQDPGRSHRAEPVAPYFEEPTPKELYAEPVAEPEVEETRSFLLDHFGDPTDQADQADQAPAYSQDPQPFGVEPDALSAEPVAEPQPEAERQPLEAFSWARAFESSQFTDSGDQPAAGEHGTNGEVTPPPAAPFVPEFVADDPDEEDDDESDRHDRRPRNLRPTSAQLKSRKRALRRAKRDRDY